MYCILYLNDKFQHTYLHTEATACLPECRVNTQRHWKLSIDVMETIWIHSDFNEGLDQAPRAAVRWGFAGPHTHTLITAVSELGLMIN